MLIRTDQTMPAIAVACVDLMLQGRDVEIPVPPTRRPGLVRAIAAELDARGCTADTWNFVDPAPADETDEPDAGEILGWGATASTPVRTPARVVLPAAALPPGFEQPAELTPSAPVAFDSEIPAHASVGASSPGPQSGGMLNAAYAIVAYAQPVMTAGLTPGPFGRSAHIEPATPRSSWALAELADLDF